MTAEYVLAYVPRLMKEMKQGNNYLLSFRELKLRSKEKIKINAARQFYFLLDGFSSQLKISSETGTYDWFDNKLNEIQHQHTGTITIENRDTQTQHVQLIVVIPENCQNEKP